MKRIKETAVVVTDPERDPSEPSRVMPANEGTSTDNFAVARIKLERMNPLAGFPPKMSRSDDSSTDSSTTPILSSFTASTEERKAVEKGDFRSIPCRNVHEKLFRDFFELVLQRAVFQSTSGEDRVVEWVDPNNLRSVVDLSLPTEGVGHEELLTLTRDIIKYSVKTGHPHFVNQLFSGEVSPVFSLMEEDVLREMRAIIGWQDGEGLFCPGGSMANGYAINLARHHR